jgi:hypothetical protein
MKNTFQLGTVIWILFSFIIQLQAQTATITVSTTTSPATIGHGTSSSNSTQFDVKTNTLVQILYFNSSTISDGANGGQETGNASLSAQVNGLTFSSINGSTIAGPATIILTANAMAGATTASPAVSKENAICTYTITQINNNNTNQFTPNTGVVIPADSGGPVNIILESSVDLINWIPADPGTYGTTTTNRFFRVRATR